MYPPFPLRDKVSVIILASSIFLPEYIHILSPWGISFDFYIQHSLLIPQSFAIFVFIYRQCYRIFCVFDFHNNSFQNASISNLLLHSTVCLLNSTMWMVIMAFYKSCKSIFSVSPFMYFVFAMCTESSQHIKKYWKVERTLDKDMLNLVFWHLLWILIWTLPSI